MDVESIMRRMPAANNGEHWMHCDGLLLMDERMDGWIGEIICRRNFLTSIFLSIRRGRENTREMPPWSRSYCLLFRLTREQIRETNSSSSSSGLFGAQNYCVYMYSLSAAFKYYMGKINFAPSIFNEKAIRGGTVFSLSNWLKFFLFNEDLLISLSSVLFFVVRTLCAVGCFWAGLLLESFFLFLSFSVHFENSAWEKRSVAFSLFA